MIGVGSVSGTGDSVGAGMDVDVVGMLVDVGSGVSVEIRVAVGEMEVAEAGTIVGLALSGVEEGGEGRVAVGLAT
jgi:hypothetical protein